MNLFIYLSVVFLFIHPTSSYNYLVVNPLFGHSHSTFMGKIADTLREAGHDVTIISIVVNSKFRNSSYTKSATDVFYIETNEELDDLTKVMENGDFSRFWTEEGNMLQTLPSYKNFMMMFEKVYANIRSQTHVLDELKKGRPQFDALIFESFMFFGKAIQEYLDVPVFIPVTSVTHDNMLSERFGEPVSPSYLSGYLTNYGNIMTFPERLSNTISYFLGKRYIVWPKWKTLHDPKKDLELETAYHRAPYVFVNSNPYLDFPRPTISKTIPIGGLTVDIEELKSKTVDEKWSNILNKRPHNVLVSFGTMFQSVLMPDSYKINIVKVMKSFKNTTFIWKYESEDVSFAKEADNIVFTKWVPQTALLADSRLSVFLTHGGLGSVNEISHLGKPAILCPLFADQLRNAKMLARHEGSIEISKFDLANYDVLRSAFQKVLHDKTIMENALLLAQKLANQPIKPKEMLVRHAEFAARFGENHGLDCNIRNMSFIEFYLIDVAAFLGSIVITVLLVIYFSLSKLYGHLVKIKQD